MGCGCSKSISKKKAATWYWNGNEFTLAIIQTLKTLIGEDFAKEVDLCKQKKENIFKEPINGQYFAFVPILLEKTTSSNNIEKDVLIEKLKK